MNNFKTLDAAVALFTGTGLFSIDSLTGHCGNLLECAKNDRNFLKESGVAKYFLTELYYHLKKKGELPELDEKRKQEIWKEAKPDKQLALSLYLLEII